MSEAKRWRYNELEKFINAQFPSKELKGRRHLYIYLTLFWTAYLKNPERPQDSLKDVSHELGSVLKNPITEDDIQMVDLLIGLASLINDEPSQTE
ncbi:MAG: hypothetical protein A2383_02605 [Candidatus Pacebacteria bacterium RIFOXYB1_FULL_39_46]|nr:MAG: hypothetical protein A2383_02605 [Candidatus Pacebacteria bacterium RIFOXYB1_FULL_39_46]OGJ39274.1 MAG: hypothetical protein A2182_02870 [Candidatus Pacebacteria bacterium RIFOXYA1_FULL_38_18]OGJ40954.1 MAG: hypothetical protein A2582_01530 [Candidatus Pacebacteria bacterium RIFOXYD1_FULL_39_27]OGJ41135.1 MAG: hypothetical protein A2411_01450 [Candidatus Pacebacteria bacterium RIFOXYC1_FULL_39_21]